MSDRGSATVWVLLAATVVWSVATWGVAAASVGATRARAATAADLAALAAAEHALLGTDEACAAARAVAESNHAELTACEVDDYERTVDVVVEARGRGLLAHAPPAHARARAGPPERSVR